MIESEATYSQSRDFSQRNNGRVVQIQTEARRHFRDSNMRTLPKPICGNSRSVERRSLFKSAQARKFSWALKEQKQVKIREKSAHR